jgi:hypothetical protein
VCDNGGMHPDHEAPDHFVPAEPVELIGEFAPISPPLSVFVDVMELLDHLDDDEAKLWEFHGKLKDLFA